MGDNLIDEFRPEIREALFDVAEHVLQTKSVKIQVDPGSKKGITVAFNSLKKKKQVNDKWLNFFHVIFLGDNFVGIVYRVTCSSEDESITASLFVKIAPEDEGKRSSMSIHEFFMRESYVYRVVTTDFFLNL